MKKLLSTLALLGATVLALSTAPARAEGEFPLDRAPDNAENIASLQHGAQLFVNYCLNCHSANLMRYSRLQDIGISQKEIEKNLLFTTDKVGNTMTVAMRPDDAKAWFGATPPDLSVEARAKNRDWLYTYLRSFYRDDTRPTGWNNMVYENVSMPHVLWQLQGQRTAKFEEDIDENTKEKVKKFVGFQQVTPGTMSPVDYDSAVADLVSYLSWMSEPTQKTRRQLGVWVLLFLGVLSFFAWRLNAAYWKDIK
ncbi:cytochrome c1 [Paraburkholderia sabiae]|jgi:ubiquinol-cytochrome c reductase cytochrome c1 subunit|uniref:Cytochrome c1 n=1 Tax=Paraburkholderia sabiae TaxID=273251 RepID=A0ABU9QIX6_9BURK|nr:cytochrome c1 [Paraburkholderia sabiae]WJZ73886.1 cytochrome c1 [Paraburkholderia sabiae]CAD6556117.1 Ammonia monooxygenase gamma subunit [Paraburkholderia sabiae]CAG9200195.1 Ammonia monooxygenase gamma subunit [Paraburkholderia sabiae]